MLCSCHALALSFASITLPAGSHAFLCFEAPGSSKMSTVSLLMDIGKSSINRNKETWLLRIRLDTSEDTQMELLHTLASCFLFQSKLLILFPFS